MLSGMSGQRGFTIIELLVTMVVMVILMTIAIVALNNSQVGARDETRKTDIEVIARQLEQNYDIGVSTIAGSRGSYLGTTSMTSANYPTIFAKAGLESLRAPDIQPPAYSFKPATSAGAQTPTVGEYIYQPLTPSDTLCTTATNCRDYVLWYRLEKDSAIQKVMSKNQ